MSESRLAAWLAPYQRRLRLASLALAVVGAAAAAGLVGAGAAFVGADSLRARGGALAVFVAALTTQALRAWRRWTLVRVAHAVEARAASLDNLLVTAEEVASGRMAAPHPAVYDELFAAVDARLSALSPAAVQPVGPAAFLAGAAVVAVTAALVTLLPLAPRVLAVETAPAAAGRVDDVAAGDLRVVASPPAYVQRPPDVSVNPSAVSVLEGSRIRIEVVQPAGAVVLRDVDGRETLFAVQGDRGVLEFVAVSSRPVIIRQAGASGSSADRLLQLRVQPDARPRVAILTPGKDLIFADGTGQVRVQIDARDDVAVHALTLHYTKVSGSGETFTFEEGEWPIAIERAGEASWQGAATIGLSALALQDGDTVVYRALARDGKPGADAAASDSYLIEIGRLSGVASTGFALPDERDRQAISQQMLIIKTERLHAAREKYTAEEFREQAQLLAIEQRMVKAEFVFMTGGDVQDEAEEAAHAHELAEGRFENSGQAELLAAIREMSRAEARLNAADTTQALAFERAALKALQRAFDRRRYLLRTLPERTRIDPARRLTGERGEARSSTLTPDAASDDSFLERARDLLAAVSAPSGARNDLALLASRVLALDPNAEGLQLAALQLSSARDDSSHADAVRQVQQAIVALMRAHAARTTPTPIERTPVTGRLVEELPITRRQP